MTQNLKPKIRQRATTSDPLRQLVPELERLASKASKPLLPPPLNFKKYLCWISQAVLRLIKVLLCCKSNKCLSIRDNKIKLSVDCKLHLLLV